MDFSGYYLNFIVFIHIYEKMTFRDFECPTKINKGKLFDYHAYLFKNIFPWWRKPYIILCDVCIRVLHDPFINSLHRTNKV